MRQSIVVSSSSTVQVATAIFFVVLLYLHLGPWAHNTQGDNPSQPIFSCLHPAVLAHCHNVHNKDSLLEKVSSTSVVKMKATISTTFFGLLKANAENCSSFH